MGLIVLLPLVAMGLVVESPYLLLFVSEGLIVLVFAIEGVPSI